MDFQLFLDLTKLLTKLSNSITLSKLPTKLSNSINVIINKYQICNGLNPICLQKTLNQPKHYMSETVEGLNIWGGKQYQKVIWWNIFCFYTCQNMEGEVAPSALLSSTGPSCFTWLAIADFVPFIIRNFCGSYIADLLSYIDIILSSMDFSKFLIFCIVSICFVHSSKLFNKLKTQHANSAFLKKTAEIELIYFGSDESLLWRFEKMAKWYDYKMNYLGNNTPAMEDKLKNHLNTLVVFSY